MVWQQKMESSVEDDEGKTSSVMSTQTEGSMELKPSAIVAQAVSACVAAQDDRIFVRTVTRLRSVLTILARRKLKKLEEDEQNKKDLKDQVDKIPKSYEDNPQDWIAYATAEHQFNLIMQAVYGAAVEEVTGTI